MSEPAAPAHGPVSWPEWITFEVERAADGTWQVVDQHGHVLAGPGLSPRFASDMRRWHELQQDDRLMGELARDFGRRRRLRREIDRQNEGPG